MNKWDQVFSEGAEFTSLNEIFLRNLLDAIKNKSKKQPRTMIDLGCGTGDALIKFAKHGISVKGYDFSEVALQKAKENLIRAGIERVELKNIDLDNLNIDGKYDIVLCKLTYAFIEEKARFLEEVKKIMHDNSIFVLITPVLYKDIEYSLKDKPGIAVDMEETMIILQRHFSNIEVFDHNYCREKIDEVTFLLMK